MSGDEFIVGGDSEDIPPGTYGATLTRLSTGESTAYGEFRIWEFALDGGHQIDASSSLKTGSKSKGFRWATNILGRQPVKGERLDLVGRRCTVVVIVGDDGWPKVAEVLPSMQAQPQPAPVAPAPAKVANVDDLPF